MSTIFYPSLIRQNLRRFWPVTALLFLFLFLFGPLALLRSAHSYGIFFPPGSLETGLAVLFSRSSISAVFILMLGVAASLILSNVLFGFLYHPKMAAGIHGLPPSRLALYVNQCLSGLIMLYVPLILNALAFIMIKWIGPQTLGTLYTAGHVGQWLNVSLVMTSLMFFIGVFVGMMTGWAQAQFVFSLIFHGLPVVLRLLTSAALSRILYGYHYFDRAPSWMEYLPIFKTAVAAYTGLSLPLTAAYLALTLIFAGLGLWCYRRRPLETAGNLIAFAWLKPVFKYGFAYCVMLCGALTVSDTMGWDDLSLLLLFSWLILGYAAAEMLLRKSFNIVNSWKGALAGLCVVGLCFFGLKADILGYENRVPAAGDIEFVCLTSNYYYYDYEHLWEARLTDPETDSASGQDSASGADYYNPFVSESMNHFNASDLNPFFFVSREPVNIDNAMAWHRQILSDKDRIPDASDDPDGFSAKQDFCVIYQLKNGRRLIRFYEINPIYYQTYMASMYESMEYKRFNFPIMTQNPEDFTMADFQHQRRKADPTPIPADRLPALIQALRTDIQNLSFRDVWENSEYAVLTFYKSGKSGDQPGVPLNIRSGLSNHYLIHPSFRATRQWLRENGYPIDPPTSAEIKSVRISSLTGVSGFTSEAPYIEPRFLVESISGTEPATVADPDVIDAILLDDGYRVFNPNIFVRNVFAYQLEFAGSDPNGETLVFEGYYDQNQPLPQALRDYLENISDSL
jgi:ABC-2 type transport system permease protein